MGKLDSAVSRMWDHRVLPANAVKVLKRAAAVDERDRAEAVDAAISLVKTTCPQCFRDEALG